MPRRPRSSAPSRMSAPMPGSRNATGTRSKTITTAAGDLELSIPKLRTGSFFPSLLERRRRIDQALFAVIMEAYVHRHQRAARSTTWSRRSARTPGSPSPRCRGSAPTSTSEVAAFADRTWPRPRSRTCSSTRPTARPGRWRPNGKGPGGVPGGRGRHRRQPPTGAARCSGSPSATPRTARSGPRSCAR